ncbi:response regulator [Terriglobus sp. ADX1]|uniref:response regulator n=1 Tax=Terriglobus sp. ADX1 TaxID=2794063 RepID=UPI003ACDD0A5
MSSEPFTCLVADGSATARELICAIVESAGLILCEAGDLNGALALACLHCPDLFIIDTAIDDAHGLYAIEQFRRVTRRAHIVAIALTGERYGAHPDVLRAAGFAHSISKPVKASQLRAVLTELLNRPDVYRTS